MIGVRHSKENEMQQLVSEINGGVKDMHPSDRPQFVAQKLFDVGYCLQSLRDEYYADQGPLRNLSLADFKKIERHRHYDNLVKENRNGGRNE
jgi:hypothetical protein